MRTATLVNGDSFAYEAVTRHGQEDGNPPHITLHFARPAVGLMRVCREEDLDAASLADVRAHLLHANL